MLRYKLTILKKYKNINDIFLKKIIVLLEDEIIEMKINIIRRKNLISLATYSIILIIKDVLFNPLKNANSLIITKSA